MSFDFTAPLLAAETKAERRAADILADELLARTGTRPRIAGQTAAPGIAFREDLCIRDKDTFSVSLTEGVLTVSAAGIRGMIYGIGLFLRKTVYRDGRITLLYDISGDYSPNKPIRGHQTGYRPLTNTYDAWTLEQFDRYYLDLMYFGANTVEHIPGEWGATKRNELMRYDAPELLQKTAARMDELDLNVSLWYPNSEKDAEEAVANREQTFRETSRVDYLFPPGSDPGDLAPEELFSRLAGFDKVLKKHHPGAGIWPSAQQPHHFPDWGERFIAELEKRPDCIDGIITGPNHAYRVEPLRRKVPMQYPIRFYPDITHNLRCEYPVHFERDDWHYALATVNSRESCNPRPCEYAALHRLTRPYVVGSVSYSEGVNDDINKAVWSALDYAPDTPVREILEDYARLFFPGADFAKSADAIFGLEKNWEGAPEENPQIEATLRLWRELAEETPSLADNWRYSLCLFRALTDAFVRRKMLFENGLLARAKRQILAGAIAAAKETLSLPPPENLQAAREELEALAGTLFRQIGIQLSVEKYHAFGWERGAVLDNLDLPVTDLPWLLRRIKRAEAMPEEDAKRFLLRCVNRNRVDADEVYYSVALHGLLQTGVTQEPEFYMDFQGDRHNVNDGSLPMCLCKLFDHYSFRAKTGGLTAGCDYVLTVTYKDKPDPDATEHTVSVNGRVLWKGTQFGGEVDETFTDEMLPDGFVAVRYPLPKEYIENGCAELLIAEPTVGCEIAEFRITKA
ncbi:MAG: hypothetical protein IJK89_01760 [Clostridia bacterium]|nr:hypothetical protein [Clostridia bacterium]